MEKSTETILFVKNFKLGTKLSEVLIDHGMSVIFADGDKYGLSQIDNDTKIAILDLDDKIYQTIAFVSGLRNMNKNIKIVGYMKVIHKDSYDRLKSAGCDLILPKSSLIKNISTVIS